jgi:hypothetical protein
VIRIGSSYNLSSISVLSGWKTLDELACKVVLATSPSLKNWGHKASEIFRGHFEASNDFFCPKRLNTKKTYSTH